jgi:hypothetical protein
MSRVYTVPIIDKFVGSYRKRFPCKNSLFSRLNDPIKWIMGNKSVNALFLIY